MIEAPAQMMLDFLLHRVHPHALDLAEHRSRTDQRYEDAEQKYQRRMQSDCNERVRKHRRVFSGGALSRHIEARHLESRKQQRYADALGQRKQDGDSDDADQMPTRNVHQHREIGPQCALRGRARLALGESVRPPSVSLRCDYGGCRQDCLSTDDNCSSGTDDATIALSVRTLYTASESDTSLQSSRTTGKSAGLPGIWFISRGMNISQFCSCYHL